MKAAARSGASKLMMTALLMAALLAAMAMPAGAVLPPGAHESLAAKAPVVVIAAVEATDDISGQIVADCRVLESGQGDVPKGAVIKVMVDRAPKRRLIGPAAKYHDIAKGQVWLLFLLNPDGYYKKFDKRLAQAYHIASHGWYTTRLDSLTSSGQLMAQLSGMTSRAQGENEQKLIRIYKWAGSWVDLNQKR